MARTIARFSGSPPPPAPSTTGRRLGRYPLARGSAARHVAAWLTCARTGRHGSRPMVRNDDAPGAGTHIRLRRATSRSSSSLRWLAAHGPLPGSLDRAGGPAPPLQLAPLPLRLGHGCLVTSVALLP